MVWAVVSVVVSPAGSADTRATIVRTSKKRSKNGEWAFQSPFRRGRMVSGRKQSIRLVLHSGSAGGLKAQIGVSVENKDSSILADQARESCHFAFLIR